MSVCICDVVALKHRREVCFVYGATAEYTCEESVKRRNCRKGT